MTIEEIENQIKNIELADTNILSIAEIKKLIDPILESVFFESPIIDSKQSLFRSVNFGNTKANSFEQIIYPPKIYLKNYQRLNEPGKPVFYCSSSINCCVLEGRYNVGDYLNISEWEVNSEQSLILSNIGYTSFLNTWSQRNVPDFHKNPKFFKNKNSEEIQRNYLVLDFMSRLFCKNFDRDNSKYKITNAIASILGFDSESTEDFMILQNDIFEGSKAMDGVIFPSILSEARYDNFAIRRHSFHKKIKFLCIEYVKILSLTEETIEYEVLDFSNELDLNQKIQWKGRPGQYTITENDVQVTIKRTSERTFQISRSDGKKMYKS